MKTAIYIEDGIVQLVVTPESEFEKNALSTFRDKPLDAKLFVGSFYDCRGGWVRQKEHGSYGTTNWGSRSDDQSLILRTSTVKDDPPAPPDDAFARAQYGHDYIPPK